MSEPQTETPQINSISDAKRRAVVFLWTVYLLRRRMGGFLDKPKTEKSQEHGQGNGLKYGVVSMQGDISFLRSIHYQLMTYAIWVSGWRVEMEDAHSAVTGLPGDFKGMKSNDGVQLFVLKLL